MGEVVVGLCGAGASTPRLCEAILRQARWAGWTRIRLRIFRRHVVVGDCDTYGGSDGGGTEHLSGFGL